jgi:hypothetical protein
MPARLLGLLLLAAVLAAGARASDSGSSPETIELIPEDRAGWSLTNLFAPITGLFLGGPGYWYSPRKVEIETTPPGAALDLFYVRRNFQKGYEQADAPVEVLLPSRVEAGPRDSLTVRAFLDGYQQKEVSIRVRSRTENLLIELEPLANSLMAVTHLYFAGRSSLSFLTKEALTFRIQDRGGEYTLVLLETGSDPEADAAMRNVHDALVASLRPQQLGEDLVVRVGLTDAAAQGELDVRQRQDYDPIRRLHSFTLDVSPRDGTGSPVQRARQALARIGPSDVSGCAQRFDAELRAQLDPSALARALTPRGSFQDPYLRAALKRLGEISPGGQVTLLDGTKYDTSVPLELAAASSQAGEVVGYLAMLRSFVAELEAEPYRSATLGGLVAPEVGPAEWGRMIERSEAAERRCRGTAARL